MVTSDFGAFPSGHSAHAAVFVVALALIFAAHRWIVPVAAIYVLLMMWSRTHVHAHWLTDTIGGALLGVGVTLIVWAALAGRVRGEWTGSVQGDDSRVQAGGVEQPQHVRDE